MRRQGANDVVASKVLRFVVGALACAACLLALCPLATSVAWAADLEESATSSSAVELEESTSADVGSAFLGLPGVGRGTGQRALRAAMARYCRAAPAGSEGSAPLGPEGGESFELVQVQILHRHGQRSAIHSMSGARTNFSCALSEDRRHMLARWPACFEVASAQAQGGVLRREWGPEVEADGRTCKPGQLTDEGFRQLHDLGSQLRVAYEKLLPNLTTGLRAEEVYARTTDYQRTRASTAALLDALLGPGAGERPAPGRIRILAHEETGEEPMLGTGLQRQFFGINEAPTAASAHLGATPVPESPCPRATRLAARQHEAFRPAKGLRENLARALGEEVMRQTATEIADALYSAGCEGDALPCADRCISAAVAVRALDDADRHFCSRYTGHEGGAEATRLGFQPVLQEVVDRLMAAAAAATGGLAGGAAPKLVVLGGHDTVVAPVAAALGFYADCNWPSLASRIVFELWRSSPRDRSGAEGGVGEAPPPPLVGVRILLNGRLVTSAVPGCRGARGASERGVCPLERFAEAVRSLLGGFPSLSAACAAS